MTEARCPTCSKPVVGTPFPCVNCWEVEGRLATYLRSVKGRELVRQALAAATPLKLYVKKLEHFDMSKLNVLPYEPEDDES